MEKRMNKEELIKLIESLNIDKEEFWVLSSGALVIRGIFPNAGDLDIGITQKGLEQLKRNFNLKQKENGWYIVNEKVECVLDTKDVEKIDSYYVENIDRYYKYLLQSTREKDQKRIPLIEKYLKEHNRQLKK